MYMLKPFENNLYVLFTVSYETGLLSTKSKCDDVFQAYSLIRLIIFSRVTMRKSFKAMKIILCRSITNFQQKNDLNS